MTNSKVLVKNDKVIVTEWSFNVGDSTGTHKHQYNYVVVPMIDGELKIIDKEIKEIVNSCAEYAKESPEVPAEELWTDIYA